MESREHQLRTLWYFKGMKEVSVLLSDSPEKGQSACQGGSRSAFSGGSLKKPHVQQELKHDREQE